MTHNTKMPHRILGPHFEIIIAWFGSMLAVTAGIDDLSNVAIWDKSQLRLWCLLGSLGGAFLTVAILPSHEHTGNYARRLALKFASSSIAGLIFTPIVIRWRGWPVDSDVVLAVSAFVALISVSTISALYPVWLKWVTNRVRREATYQQPQPETTETE